MKLGDLAKWNTRFSAVYALGIWTMVTSYAYYRYTGRYDEKPPGEEEKKETPKNPNEVLYETPHTRSVFIYKKDFVPYTTRIKDYIKSLSSSPGDGDK